MRLVSSSSAPSLFLSCSSSSGSSGNQEISDLDSSVVERFEARVGFTISCIRKMTMTLDWHLTLKETSDEEIIPYFTECTPRAVQAILGREDPPTWEDLMGLDPWKGTTAPGVCTRLMSFTGVDPNFGNRHLYVGSATGVWGGLQKRMEQHIHPKQGQECSYHRLLLRDHVPSQDRFAQLFVAPGQDEIDFIRRLCLLAEAAFTAILGGYRESVNTSLRMICPYGFPGLVFSWKGACSHSCLGESQRRLKPESRDKYSAEDDNVALSFDELVRRSEEAQALYFQEYHRKRRASLGDTVWRERAWLAKQRWRAEHRDEIVERRNNRTEEEVLAHRAKKTEEMRRYRRDNKDKIKAREAALPLEEKQRRSAVSHSRTKKFRAKQKLENPKPTHIVPDKKKGRNSQRNEQRKADPHQAKKASFQMRVSRAKKKLDKVRSDGSSPEAVHKATVDLAVAQVERYNFTMSIGIEPSIQPSAEDWELAASRP